jgi:hypothetical protein
MRRGASIDRGEVREVVKRLTGESGFQGLAADPFEYGDAERATGDYPAPLGPGRNSREWRDLETWLVRRHGAQGRTLAECTESRGDIPLVEAVRRDLAPPRRHDPKIEAVTPGMVAIVRAGHDAGATADRQTGGRPAHTATIAGEG